MTQAGHSAAKPLKVKVQISASGSGQMQPLPMNEFAQQSLKQCFFDVQFDVLEWNTLFTNWRKGAKDPSANGSHAINVSYAAMDPFFAMVRFTSTKTFPPTSNNWGYFGNAEFDKLIGDGAQRIRRQSARRRHSPNCTPVSSKKRHSCGSRTTSAHARWRRKSRELFSRRAGSLILRR